MRVGYKSSLKFVFFFAFVYTLQVLINVEDFHINLVKKWQA